MRTIRPGLIEESAKTKRKGAAPSPIERSTSPEGRFNLVSASAAILTSSGAPGPKSDNRSPRAFWMNSRRMASDLEIGGVKTFADAWSFGLRIPGLIVPSIYRIGP